MYSIFLPCLGSSLHFHKATITWKNSYAPRNKESLVTEVQLKEEKKHQGVVSRVLYLFPYHLASRANAGKFYLLRGSKPSATKSVPLDGNVVTVGMYIFNQLWSLKDQIRSKVSAFVINYLIDTVYKNPCTYKRSLLVEDAHRGHGIEGCVFPVGCNTLIKKY